VTPGRRIALALPLAVAVAASGCVSLADRIAEPRGEVVLDGVQLARMLEQDGVQRRDFTTPEGVRISWLDVPAAERGFSYDYRHRIEDGQVVAAFSSRTDRTPVPVPARGTVVLLHGWQMDATAMLGWGEALSERGWRGVAVDLRNFGSSSRAPAGFGTREAHDVAALVDALRARDEAPDPVFLFGVSYGAATALFAEPLLRGRIAGIVAMEPFGNAAGAIRDLARHERTTPAHGAVAHVSQAWARLRYGDATVERAINAASDRLGLDLATVDTATPLAASQTCTLLLHGARDGLVPVAAARHLAAAAPATRYVELPDESHLTLPLRIDRLAAPLADWMDAVATGRCPPLVIAETGPTSPGSAGTP
jgi:pimeloyl-ACP methyl ester carboxylesterase